MTGLAVAVVVNLIFGGLVLFLGYRVSVRIHRTFVAEHDAHRALRSRLIQAMTWYETCTGSQFTGVQVANRLYQVLSQPDVPDWDQEGSATDV